MSSFKFEALVLSAGKFAIKLVNRCIAMVVTLTNYLIRSRHDMDHQEQSVSDHHLALYITRNPVVTGRKLIVFFGSQFLLL